VSVTKQTQNKHKTLIISTDVKKLLESTRGALVKSSYTKQ